LDEICPCCKTKVGEVRAGAITEFDIEPTIARDCRSTDRKYTPDENAEIFLRIARGEDSESYEYEILCANAGAGFAVAGKANSVQEGIELAKRLLAERKVDEQLAKVKEAYAKHAS
jgi:anthranilate phosphoribosyltransferase